MKEQKACGWVDEYFENHSIIYTRLYADILEQLPISGRDEIQWVYLNKSLKTS